MTRWRLEPRLSLLILAGLYLSCAHCSQYFAAGQWPWSLVNKCGGPTLHGCGLVEEGLMRIGTIRKILQDVNSSTMDTVTLSKQTLQEVFYPQIDNGYLWHSNAKKKEKVC